MRFLQAPSVLLTALLLCVSLSHAAADDLSESAAGADYVATLLAFRDNMDFRFRDRILSPLPAADRQTFDGLEYFEIAPVYAVAASFRPARDRSTFAMPTFNNKTLTYSHYGTVSARLADREVQLKAFRRDGDRVLRDFLLIPFRDPTNGVETYAGGRYIEVELPLPDEFVLDFNKAMNPWCAYDASYACPIPPPENHLNLPIPAGEKRYK